MIGRAAQGNPFFIRQASRSIERRNRSADIPAKRNNRYGFVACAATDSVERRADGDERNAPSRRVVYEGNARIEPSARAPVPCFFMIELEDILAECLAASERYAEMAAVPFRVLDSALTA
jgi:hypothetical protein